MAQHEGRITTAFIDIFVKRPCLAATCIMVFVFLLSGIGFASYPFTIDTSGVTFVPRSSYEYELQETFQLGEERTRFNAYRTPSNANVTVPQQTQDEYQLTVLFAVRQGDDLFTEARLTAIRNAVSAVTSLSDADGNVGFEQVCLRSRTTGTCSSPDSLLPYFFAEQVTGCPTSFDASGASSTYQLTPEQTLRALVEDDAVNSFCSSASASNCSQGCRTPNLAEIQWAVSDDFGYPNGNTSLPLQLSSDVTRVIVRFGLPLAGFNDPDDRYDDQIEIIEKFVRRAADVLDARAEEENVDVRTISPVLTADYFWDLVIGDATLVVVSIVMVQVYIIFHVQSFFLGMLGMLHILMSFPLAYLFTQASMDFGGMGILNLMALFIILGIGSDDVFVLYDHWKQSRIEASQGEASLASSSAEERSEANIAWTRRRLSWSYSRAVEAMLITSLTTGAAFVMNLSSTVPAIQIFGGFTAFMILFNYLMVITWYPCVIVLYQYYGQYWWSPLSLCVKKNKSPIETNAADKAPSNPDDRDVSQYRWTERKFYTSFGPFVYKYRYWIVGFFVAWFVLCLGFATQLEAAEEPAQWLPDDDPLQQTFDLLTDRFGRQTVPPQIAVVYGLKVVDNDGINPYDPNSVGKTRYDTNFDVSEPSAQQAFIDICDRFQDAPYVYNREVLCPMKLFKAWREAQSLAFPVPQADFVIALANFTAAYELAEGPAPDYSGLTSSSDQDAASREERRREELELYATIRFDLESSEPVLRYLAIIINTTLPVQASGSQIEKVYDAWNDIMDRENALAANVAANLNNGFQTGANYLDMVLEQTLLSAAVIGIGASISLAFVIILLLTADLLLSVMSIVAIGGVVTSLIAIVVWLGWSLSIIESICLTILVGLSVDYVIHMANAYRESSSLTRYGRVRDAFLLMAISVLSASITSILSAFVLLFTTVIFFFKFGAFILLTIVTSTFWAFLFFMALLSISGHTTRHNDFKWLYNKVRLCCGYQVHQETARNTEPSPVIDMDRLQSNKQIDDSQTTVTAMV